ncbi:MAG: chemotaxis protein CheW [Mariprofundaceae bacterium]|nr:chemotaxis protein CheW [Mariprofundaceae bacterium]
MMVGQIWDNEKDDKIGARAMDEELLSEFLTESNENLASIEQQLMDLEMHPSNVDLLDGIFRAVHTVKGSCGFLGLVGLQKTAHAGENLLGKIRATKYLVNDEVVSLLLECTDGIKALLEGLEAEGAEPDLDHSDLIERLHIAERMVEDFSTSAKHKASEELEEAVQNLDWLGEFDPLVLTTLKGAKLFTAQDMIDAGFARLRETDGLTPADALKILGVAKKTLKAAPMVVKHVAKSESKNNVEDHPKNIGEEDCKPPSKKGKLVSASPQTADKSAAKSQTPKATNTPVKAVPKTGSKQQRSKSAGSIRVDIELLDSLMNQVGELVLTRNRLMQMMMSSGNMAYVRVSRDVDHITEQLQAQLLRTRMQPIQSVWSSIPRIVRDMGKQLDKKITVIMEGEETELDRTILNALKDPLTHIIRNSCDHGIEMPDERRNASKPVEGTLKLSASQESGFIVILIEDDGAGIDASRVKSKAVSMGVLTEDQAAIISDKAVLQLIFHAGLSTAEQVSNLSGRGVGMDVVRTEIEKVGGSVDISSERGVGTTLRIRIPLTLAIISAMIIGCDGHRFAIPQMSVRELLNAPADSSEWRLIGGQPFYRLRGKLLPVMRLKEVLEFKQNVDNEGSIVVVDIGDRTYGVLVDEIFGAEEIVVKPLGIHFQQTRFYGGCSILGDGVVIPIFDCNELASLMKLSQEAEAIQHLEEEKEVSMHELQHTLVFAEGGQRFAIPMALIERLECFPEKKIEHSGSSEVLQYRDDVIAVLRWSALIGGHRDISPDDSVYGLILSDGYKCLCLQVEEVVDILEIPLDIKMTSDNPLFLGTSVIEDLATEVVDVFEVVKQVDPNWFSRNKSVASTEEFAVPTILFVEDATFFRNLVIPVLDTLGYETWVAKDGLEACAILEDKIPDLILTDLEMPNMDGYGLLDWVKDRPELSAVPVVALTATPIDEIPVESQKKFRDVMIKFDRQTLTEGLKLIMDDIQNKKPFSVEGELISSTVTQGD